MSRSFSRCLVEARRWTAPNAVCIVTLWAMFSMVMLLPCPRSQSVKCQYEKETYARRKGPSADSVSPDNCSLTLALQITFSPLVIHAQLLEPAICWVCLWNCRWSRFANNSSLCSCLSQRLSCLWVRFCCLGHFLLGSSLAVSLTDITMYDVSSWQQTESLVHVSYFLPSFPDILLQARFSIIIFWPSIEIFLLLIKLVSYTG